MTYSIQTDVGLVSPASLSCADVSQSVQQALCAAWGGGCALRIASCSTDPVDVGTGLTWDNGQLWTVGAITSSTPAPAPTSSASTPTTTGQIDYGFFLVFALAALFAMGFSAGLQR